MNLASGENFVEHLEVTHGSTDQLTQTEITELFSKATELFNGFIKFKGTNKIIKAYVNLLQFNAVINALNANPFFKSQKYAHDRNLNINRFNIVMRDFQTLRVELIEKYDKSQNLPKQQTVSNVIASQNNDNVSEKPIHKILVPQNLTRDFETVYALTATENDQESCALLCGSFDSKQNKYLISHSILPKQQGTPNAVVISEEEEIPEITEGLNLMVLGWIHTHPSQGSFLSSVDLHTQYQKQSDIPSSIAIVVAPTDSTKIFHLTDLGLSVLAKCDRNPSQHHPHQNTELLYREANHCEITTNLLCEFIDLRNQTPTSYFANIVEDNDKNLNDKNLNKNTNTNTEEKIDSNTNDTINDGDIEQKSDIAQYTYSQNQWVMVYDKYDFQPYAAQILDQKCIVNEEWYFVHFFGFGPRYDEWIPIDRVLKQTTKPSRKKSKRKT